MKKILIFILGLIIGVLGYFAYSRYVKNPELIENTRSQAILEAKEQIEQEIVQQSLLLIGTVLSLSGEELTLEVEQTNGMLVTYNVLTSSNTLIMRAKNDEASSRESIALTEISIGSRISVIASEPVDSLNIYAKEILSL